MAAKTRSAIPIIVLSILELALNKVTLAFNWYLEVILLVKNRRELVHNIVAGVLTTALVFSLSIFLYATFYHAYMPIEVEI